MKGKTKMKMMRRRMRTRRQCATSGRVRRSRSSRIGHNWPERSPCQSAQPRPLLLLHRRHRNNSRHRFPYPRPRCTRPHRSPHTASTLSIIIRRRRLRERPPTRLYHHHHHQQQQQQQKQQQQRHTSTPSQATRTTTTAAAAVATICHRQCLRSRRQPRRHHRCSTLCTRCRGLCEAKRAPSCSPTTTMKSRIHLRSLVVSTIKKQHS